MDRRFLLAVGASALILAGTLPATAFAAGPDRTPRRIDVSKIDVSKIDPRIRSLMDERTRTVTVILQLQGTPAVRAGGTRAVQQAQAKTLRSSQKAVAAAVAKRGAKVQATYQYAYNGLRVRTTSDKLGELAAIPGVIGVRPVRVYERTNVNGVPRINAPVTWAGGATGAGTLIAVIDTGIDYTHANFGGPGTPDAFTGNDGRVVEAGTFPTTKVIAGKDFAGDDYDASSEDPLLNTPVEDPDPIDCNGHGSHVAGSAAGFGVDDDQETYTGLYDADTIGDGSDFVIAPGVAPEAKLVALKVFGCEGSTDVVADALEWVAAYNASHIVGIDVVNMSLGSPFGVSSDAEAAFANNVIASGTVVVASAGNDYSVDYITAAPATLTKAISVAALDLSSATFPGATVPLVSGTVTAINANAGALPVTGPIRVLFDGPAVSLGCAAGDYGAVTAGDIVVTLRGTCARTDRATLGQAAGAAAVIMINNGADLPPFEGPIPGVTIPFLGALAADEAALVGADGQTVTITPTTVTNNGYRKVAPFSSSAPRWGDSWLKPDVAAPGVSIVSTLAGSGWNGTTNSGTSMAAPMTAGAAALVTQAHPGWSPLRVKAALSNTADNASVAGYTVLRSGSGAIRVDRASKANVIATTSDGTASLSYGYVQATKAWSSAKKITITNDGASSAKYTLASSSSSVKLSATSVTVPARSSVTVTATAALSANAVARLCSADPWTLNSCGSLYTRSGAITATPVGTKAGQYALRVPFLIAPRGVSSVTASRSSTWTKTAGKISGRINLVNTSYHAGNADVYALGPTDTSGDAKVEGVVTKVNGTDIRAAGVQVHPSSFLDPAVDPTDKAVIFAVTMHDRFSTAAPHEVDILVNNDADPDAEFIVFGYDYGLMTAGAFSGMWVAWVYDVDQDAIISAWLADAPLNGSTVLLPALASELGLSAGDGSFTYQLFSYDGFTGAEDATSVSRAFDAYAPKQSTGQWKAIKGRTASTSKISTSVGAWFYRVPSVRGWLVVTMDDRNGSYQADVVSIPSKP